MQRGGYSEGGDVRNRIQTRFAKLTGFSVLLILLMSLTAMPAHACTPAPETPWFLTDTHLVATSLPKSVSVTDAEDGTVLLQNKTDSELRIILSGDYQEQGGYEQVTSGGSAIFAVDPWSENLDVDGHSITFLQRRNVFADNRPAKADLPDPQIAWAQVLQDRQSYFIQLRVDYRLNDHYDSGSVYAYEHLHCPGVIDAPAILVPIGGLIAGAALIIVPLLVIARLRRHGETSAGDTQSEEKIEP
jgi:hypothetical protein